MTTLIAALDKDRHLAMCCEACYNAKGPRCKCVCGGEFHGIGLTAALKKLPQAREKIRAELKDDFTNIIFPQRTDQLWLFPHVSETSSDST